MHMKRPTGLHALILAFSLCAAIVGAQDRTAEELQKLQGGWQVVAAEQRGKPFDAIRGGALVIEDKTFLLKTAAGNEFRGEVRIDPAQSPKHLDLVHENSGPVWEAIYSVTDDTLRLNYVEAGGRDARPTLFATTADSGGTVIVMSRMAQR
jgi:uncharacterized protein (TIGR03067 family)